MCGKIEHIHTLDCYTQVTAYSEQTLPGTSEPDELTGTIPAVEVVHIHGPECYDESGQLVCPIAAPLEEVDTHALICTIPEGDGAHTHSEECYDESGQLICQKEESEGHLHGPLCYDNWELICTIPEGDGAHTHEEACYDESGQLICQKEESEGHLHGPLCYDNWELICTIPEGDGAHTHEEACYDESGQLICQKEEGEGHRHTLRCYALQEPESPISVDETVHIHGPECYDESGQLSCPLEQIAVPEPDATIPVEENLQILTPQVLPSDPLDFPELTCTIPEGDGAHTHTAECYDESGQLVCQLEESAGHQHTPLCYGHWELTCGLEEHTHTDACFPKPALDEQTIEASLYTDGSYSQKLEGEARILLSGQLPEDAEAKAYPVLVEIEGKQVLCAYDITVFDAGGAIYEPAEPLLVNICSSLLDLGEDAQAPEVYYVPDDGQAESVEGTFEDGSVTFAAPHFSVYAVASPLAGGVEEGQHGSRTYYINWQRNAFTRDSTYAKYYNEDNPLGVAGNFHLVAFDTLELRSHTNGNVLAKTLIANSNFGTNNYPDEISYVQNYQSVNGGSASMADHILVIGSSNTIGLTDNGNALSVNGQKLDRPNHVLQDYDTEAAPFIDLAQVKAETSGIGAMLAQMPDQKITANYTDQNNRSINLNAPNTVGVCTLTTSQLSEFQNNRLDIKGFTKGGHGAIIINVDCAGAKEIYLPQEACIFIDGQKQSTNEVTEFSAGKVIWNFTNAENTTIHTRTMTGIILAPGAKVVIHSNLNGTVVADNISVEAESHRTDFTGKIVEPPPQVKDAYVILQKVDQENIAMPLPKAEFDLYVWDSSKNDYSFYQHYDCDPNGQAILEDLEYNTAYRLVETTAPDGYILGEKPYDFCFDSADTSKYPLCKPAGFVGTSLDNGDIRYIRNEKQPPPELTSITIQKNWHSESGAPYRPAEAEIKFELWRRAEDIEEKVETYTLTAAEQWKLTISDLPETGTDAKGKKISYVYYVKEVPVDGYVTEYQNNDGIAEGTIRITNTVQRIVLYELPATGGAGTQSYTAGGLLLLAVGIALLYSKNKHGKGDCAS